MASVKNNPMTKGLFVRCNRRFFAENIVPFCNNIKLSFVALVLNKVINIEPHVVPLPEAIINLIAVYYGDEDIQERFYALCDRFDMYESMSHRNRHYPSIRF